MAEPNLPPWAPEPEAPEPAAPKRPSPLRWPVSGWRLNVVLFGLTVATTWWVGGPAYSAALLAILVTHEMGHFVTAKLYGVKTSLPYFIPVPFPPFGTFGAVIKMDDRIPDRRALVAIGAAGPLAGMVVAIPVLLYGLSLSQVTPAAGPAPALTDWGLIGVFQHGLAGLDSPFQFTLEGNSLLYFGAKHLLFDIPPGSDVWIHPVAFAGWIGLFVTALNMLPVAQLDGGHVAYGLLGERAHALNHVVRGVLLGLGLTLWYGWLMVVVLVSVVLWLSGGKHPPVQHPDRPLTRGAAVAGLLALVVLAISFAPIPMRGYGLTAEEARALPATTKQATGLCDARIDWLQKVWDGKTDVGPEPTCPAP